MQLTNLKMFDSELAKPMFGLESADDPLIAQSLVPLVILFVNDKLLTGTFLKLFYTVLYRLYFGRVLHLWN